MRNVFIYGGAYFGADRTSNVVGSLKSFPLWAQFLVVCFIIGMAIIGGLGGAFLNDTIKYLKEKWNGTGKKKAPKLFLM